MMPLISGVTTGTSVSVGTEILFRGPSARCGGSNGFLAVTHF